MCSQQPGGFVLVCILACMLFVVPLSAAEVGYEVYTDWAGWARLSTGQHAGLASSFDRSGANVDHNYYEFPEGFVDGDVLATSKTINGPGVINRFWMPHATDSFAVRMFFDGEQTPRIDTTSGTIFSDAFSFFSAPFVDTAAGGQVCYERIPFTESLRIETVNQEIVTFRDWHYYQYSYTQYPIGSVIESFTGTLSGEQQAARLLSATILENSGQHPAANNPNSVCLSTPMTSISPGTSQILLATTGPGIVRRINLAMSTATDEELDGMILTVTYDAEPTPAIQAPVSMFFGAGHARVPYESLPIGTNSLDGFYSFWPMPFREAVTIALNNNTAAPITIEGALVEYEPTSFGVDMGYLRVQTATSVWPDDGNHHFMLSATGRGHYVGNLLFVEQQHDSFQILEGDEIITVDGSDIMYGTGLEDAYNGGFYYNWVGIQSGEPEGPMPQSAIRPLSGLLYINHDATTVHARADQYRWYIADRVSFHESIEVKIESFFSRNSADWQSVAFWYEHPGPLGDMDGDGDVDIDDLNVFRLVLLGLDNQPDHLYVSDLNGDGAANGLDTQAFIDAMIGG